MSRHSYGREVSSVRNMAESEGEDQVRLRVTNASLAGRAEFVTNVEVRKPGEMVWVDFSQADPDDIRAVLIVSRLVLHPALLDDLIEQLSKIRDET